MFITTMNFVNDVHKKLDQHHRKSSDARKITNINSIRTFAEHNRPTAVIQRLVSDYASSYGIERFPEPDTKTDFQTGNSKKE